MDVISQLSRLTASVNGLTDPASMTYDSSLVVMPNAADATRARRGNRKAPCEVDSMVPGWLNVEIAIKEDEALSRSNGSSGPFIS